MTASGADAAEDEDSRRRRELTGIACVLGSALALSLKGIFAKYLFADGVEVVTVLALRNIIALPLLALVAAWIVGGVTKLAMAPRDLLLAMLGGLIGYWAASVLDFHALTLIDVSVERVLLFSFPVFVLVLDSFRRRRPPPGRQVLALVGAEAGIVLVMGVTDPAVFFANLEGGLYAIASAFVFSFYYMLNQHLGPRLGSARMALAAVAGAFLGTTGQFLATMPVEALMLSRDGWVWITGMAVFCSVLPFLLITEGIRRVGASRSALISTVGPAATLVLAALLLGERLSWTQLGGAGLVFASILALEGRLPRFRRPVRPRGPTSREAGSP